MTRWLFVRHGESTANLAKTYSGQTDVPLTQRGHRQATTLGHKLAERLGGRSLEAVWSSDLQRAIRTAECMLRSSQSDLPIHTHGALREQNLGMWEGKPIEWVQSQSPNQTPMAWNRRAPGGESLNDVARRAVALLASLHPSEANLIVSHGGLLRAIIGLIDGVPKSVIGETAIPNAQFIIRDMENGRWSAIADELLR